MFDLANFFPPLVALPDTIPPPASYQVCSCNHNNCLCHSTSSCFIMSSETSRPSRLILRRWVPLLVIVVIILDKSSSFWCLFLTSLCLPAKALWLSGCLMPVGTRKSGNPSFFWDSHWWIAAFSVKAAFLVSCWGSEEIRPGKFFPKKQKNKKKGSTQPLPLFFSRPWKQI